MVRYKFSKEVTRYFKCANLSALLVMARRWERWWPWTGSGLTSWRPAASPGVRSGRSKRSASPPCSAAIFTTAYRWGQCYRLWCGSGSAAISTGSGSAAISTGSRFRIRRTLPECVKNRKIFDETVTNVVL